MKAKLVLCMYSMMERYYSLKQKGRNSRLLSDERGFGMNELLGIAAALILAAFIVIPGLKKFTEAVMGEIIEWWNGIGNDIFPKSAQ